MREFNAALLGKWCWRTLVDKAGLWFRVLAARYGVEIGCLREGGRSGSSWWREIVRIRDGIGDLGGEWRLIELSENKSSKVAEMSALGWEAGGEAWVWQRQLWVWEEEMLGECQALLHDFFL
ncbi:receptor-like kinase [Trifolium medium]|uniref:Receptor-like kinase n=1 Tax=Trifolium medium TaxID=97028 RepID=A0A392Q955_9FABA|nr:receptor-like kinase [Trifolium medium]